MSHVVIGLGPRSTLGRYAIYQMLAPHFPHGEVMVLQSEVEGGGDATANERASQLVKKLKQAFPNAHLCIGIERELHPPDNASPEFGVLFTESGLSSCYLPLPPMLWLRNLVVIICGGTLLDGKITFH